MKVQRPRWIEDEIDAELWCFAVLCLVVAAVGVGVIVISGG